MSDLVVIAFSTEAKAEEVRQKLLAMQKEHLIKLSDAAIAVKDIQGRIKLNQLIHNCRNGLRHLLGNPNWSDLLDAVGRRSPRGGVWHVKWIFGRCWYRRQVDERGCCRHPARNCSAVLLMRKVTADKALGAQG